MKLSRNGFGAPRRALVIIVLAVAAGACRQDMHDAPRYEALEASTFFTDGRSSRALVPNTVARGLLREDEHLYQGKIDGQLADPAARVLYVGPLALAFLWLRRRLSRRR